MSRINKLSKDERKYREKLKQMAQSQLDLTNYFFHQSNNLATDYGKTLSVTAQLCIAANIVTLTESVERLTEEIVKSNDHRLDDIDNETKEDDYEDNMFLLDDDN